MSKLSQILGAVAVVLIALVFILQFQPATQSKIAASAGPTCAIEIQGDCISTAHWSAAYRLLAPRGADADALRAMGLRRRTSDALIERWLLNKDAKRLSVTVSEEDVNEALANGRAYVSLPVADGPQNRLSNALLRAINVKNRQTNKFDSKIYEREIRTYTQLSAQEFRDFERQEMIAARMRDLIRERVHVGDAEAFDFYSRDKSTATIGYVKFDARFYSDVATPMDQKSIDDWSLANKELIDKTWEGKKSQYLPECRLAREIYVAHDGTDERKAEAKKKIDALLARLGKGEAFADVAKSESEAEDTNQKGGELGCVGKPNPLPKPVSDKLFALEQGKVSEAIETENGYYLVLAEQIAKDADAEAIGKRLVTRELYQKHEGDRLAAEAAKQVRAAVAGGKTLEDALKAHMDELTEKLTAGDKKDKKKDAKKDAKKEGEDKSEEAPKPAWETHANRPVVEASLPFNISGTPISDAGYGQDVARIAFDLQKTGDVSNDVIPLARGYAVIQLKDKKPADKEQWEKDREDYVYAMRMQKEHDALINYVKGLRAPIEKEIKVKPEYLTEPKPEKKGGDAEAPEEDPLGGE